MYNTILDILRRILVFIFITYIGDTKIKKFLISPLNCFNFSFESFSKASYNYV